MMKDSEIIGCQTRRYSPKLPPKAPELLGCCQDHRQSGSLPSSKARRKPPFAPPIGAGRITILGCGARVVVDRAWTPRRSPAFSSPRLTDPVRGDLASGVTDMRRGMNTRRCRSTRRGPAGDLFVFRASGRPFEDRHDGVALRQAAGARALRLAVGAGGVGRDLWVGACLHAGRDRLAPSENDLATAQRGLSLRQIDSGGRTGLAGRRGFWFTPAHDVRRPQPRR